MRASRHNFLLFAEANVEPVGSRWRFLLEQLGGDYRFAAADYEDESRLERLELLSVVRGLEALEGPARVTLVTRSRYVHRGLRRGLEDWRANGWQWERFGQWTPIRDADLWRRVDGALNYHQVRCRLWQFTDPAGSWPVAARRRVPREAPQRGLAGDLRNGWQRTVEVASSRSRGWRAGALAAT